MTFETDEVNAMIEDCMKRESKMTSWECEFIQSLEEQNNTEHGLSKRQLAMLEEIWERIT